MVHGHGSEALRCGTARPRSLRAMWMKAKLECTSQKAGSIAREARQCASASSCRPWLERSVHIWLWILADPGHTSTADSKALSSVRLRVRAEIAAGLPEAEAFGGS